MKQDRSVIESVQNPRVVACSKLSMKKFRDESGLFAFEGIKLYEEAVSAGLYVEEVFVTPKAEHAADFSRAKAVRVVSERVYSKLSGEMAPQGVFTVAKKPEYSLTTADRILILDSVADPGNTGAVLRSARAFGFGFVAFCGDSCDPFNPKAVRAAMGATFRVPFAQYEDTSEFVEMLKKLGYRVHAAVCDGDETLGTCAFSGKNAFVIGNEGHGISDEVIGRCTDRITIPMRGETESLNAAVAASVIMWEAGKC